MLPAAFRDYEVFDLDEVDGRVVLTPLTLKPATPGPARRWVQSDVQKFMEKEFFPSLVASLSTISLEVEGLKAVVLFGSYAKKNAMSHSDIDLALIGDVFPSFKERKVIHELFYEACREKLLKLKEHQVNDELSLVYLLSKGDEESFPPIYKEVAKDGQFLYGDETFWRKWKKAFL